MMAVELLDFRLPSPIVPKKIVPTCKMMEISIKGEFTMASVERALGQSRGDAGMNMGGGEMQHGTDQAQSVIQTADKRVKEATGLSLLHILTLGSIGASIALLIAGKKSAALFVGLWPPTIQSLKSVIEGNKK